MKTQACIWLSPEDRAALEGWVADRNTPQKLVWRARIVLLSAEQAGKMAIVRAVGKCKRTVDRWQERYLARGLAGLRRDATRRGRKAPLAAAVIERVVEMTLQQTPPAATHWSARVMAKAAGISHTSVQRIWSAHGLKPHFGENLQTLERQALCREGQRRGRAVSRSTGPRPGVLGRREKPNPGA
jgi:transposase